MDNVEWVDFNRMSDFQPTYRYIRRAVKHDTRRLRALDKLPASPKLTTLEAWARKRFGLTASPE